MGYNWIYTTWNDNEYILFLIIIILSFIIIDFGLWKHKTDTFNDIDSNNNINSDIKITKHLQNIPNTTAIFQPPNQTNPMNNIFITDKDKANWKKASAQLDGNDESLFPNDTNTNTNNISQIDSTLYNHNNVSGVDYNKIGDYATIDNLGKSITETLGGIKSNLGYTVLEEQLGTFNPNNVKPNPNTYDNIQGYKTGMNPDTVSGVSTNGTGSNYHLLKKTGQPIIMQKDFAGVANIFAPNIYISNPPLNTDGYPDISYSV